MEERDPVREEVSSIFEEVRRQVQSILGTPDIEVDRNKLWELELFYADTRIIEAAARGDPNALMAVVEFRERIIEQRFPLDEKYKNSKKKIDEEFIDELTKLSRRADDELTRRRFNLKFYEWIMERIRLQNEHMRSQSVLKVVASVFLGKNTENDIAGVELLE